MIVGVISDSHDNIHALQDVLKRLIEHRVEMIFHLGDIISPFTVKIFKELVGHVPVVAIRGNNDGDVYQLTTLFARYGWTFFSEPVIFEVSGRRLLLVHGYGSVENTRNLVYALAKSINVDAVFYGHTHLIDVEKLNGKLVLNPGEVCGYLADRKSYALVDLDTLKAEIYIL